MKFLRMNRKLKEVPRFASVSRIMNKKTTCKKKNEKIFKVKKFVKLIIRN